MEKEEIENLATLARIELTDPDIEWLHVNLSKILDYMTDLSGIDTSQEERCHTVFCDKQIQLSDDVEEEPLTTSAFLENAPAHTAGMIRVPVVL